MKNKGVIFILLVLAGSVSFLLFSYLSYKPNTYVPSVESLLGNEKDIVAMSELNHIADAARKCLLSNSIKTAQSESERAQLLSGKNAASVNYLAEIEGVRPSDGAELRDLTQKTGKRERENGENGDRHSFGYHF